METERDLTATNVKQPKTLAELARKRINQEIASAPRLRDLPLPQRLIRDLEEKYAEDHLDYEALLSGCKTAPDFDRTLFLANFTDYSRTLEPLEVAAILKYPKNERGNEPFGCDYQTVITEWTEWDYAGRTYKVCQRCATELYRGTGKRSVRHFARKNILTRHQLMDHAMDPDNWCHVCLCTSLFWTHIWIHEKNIDETIEFAMEIEDDDWSYPDNYYSWGEEYYYSWGDEYYYIDRMTRPYA